MIEIKLPALNATPRSLWFAPQLVMLIDTMADGVIVELIGERKIHISNVKNPAALAQELAAQIARELRK